MITDSETLTSPVTLILIKNKLTENFLTWASTAALILMFNLAASFSEILTEALVVILTASLTMFLAWSLMQAASWAGQRLVMAAARLARRLAVNWALTVASTSALMAALIEVWRAAESLDPRPKSMLTRPVIWMRRLVETAAEMLASVQTSA
ncbi:MAG: hypothetical protein JOS17DRAFT_760286 [Linnemannia elongata]|nr:MAG: hypothetical protein JOS17DRAFT_760286 [Linnemannia elongata]